MRVLYAAAEIFPFAKSGGLADIAYALPKALSAEADVTAVMPLYRFIEKERFNVRATGERFTLKFGGGRYGVEIFVGTYEGAEFVFVYNTLLCDRDHLYGPPGAAYEDNDLRFAVFCHALVELTKRHSFDLLHLNDWHTAPAAVLARDAGLRAKTLFTIHNLAYQGVFDPASLKRTGIAKRHFDMEECEFYGRVNWMKCGIAHADAVTTVSPSYAVEIQEPEYGCGLDGFLRRHKEKLSGILNGIETTVFDPMNDPALAAGYGAGCLDGKRICKESLLKEIDMDKYELPLFIFIGRFTEQKGVELIIEAAGELAKRQALFSILGEGDPGYVDELRRISERYENFHLRVGYDEALSHRMYAAADFLLMPSRFEPCGLNQMIAMRYGAVPVVHAVGGLRDTVHPLGGAQDICGLGFLFDTMDFSALVECVDSAIALHKRGTVLERIVEFNMECDFSIERCASRYLELYRRLV